MSAEAKAPQKAGRQSGPGTSLEGRGVEVAAPLAAGVQPLSARSGPKGQGERRTVADLVGRVEAAAARMGRGNPHRALLLEVAQALVQLGTVQATVAQMRAAGVKVEKPVRLGTIQT